MSKIKIRQNMTHNSLILHSPTKMKTYYPETPINSFLNYPQKKSNPQKKQKYFNYIVQNKKNLKNFFSDRIPHSHIKIISQNQFFSPIQIMIMRKHQYQKQQNTKIKFNKSIDNNQSISNPIKYKKYHHYSNNNSKYLQIQHNNYKDLSKNFYIKKCYSTSTNHRTPTSNSLIKYKQTLKNKVYNSVFGDQQSNLQIPYKQNKKSFNLLQPQTKQFKFNKNHIHLKNKNTQSNKKLKLIHIIQKLQDFHQNIKFSHQQSQNKIKNQSNINPQQQITQQKKQNVNLDSQILQWVKNASQNYNKKITAISPITNIQDIQKVDSTYYKKMINHKKNRLLVRRQVLSDISLMSRSKKSARQNLKLNELNQQQNSKTLYQSFDSKQLNLQLNKKPKYSISNLHLCTKISPSLSLTQKFRQITILLMNYLRLAKLSNIKKQKIPTTFWKTRKPFQLQGSYVMFKLIKTNNIQIFKKFILKNQQYIHQIDQQYRTCLIFAVQNNSIQIVNILLQLGVNIDFQDINHCTALIYAIQNNNYQLVETLLKSGANPWSTQTNNINKLIQLSDNKIKLVIKNARKIHLARSLHSNLSIKNQFWNYFKNIIQGNQIIKFC